MLMHLQLIFFQVLIGMGIGFYFTDKKAGISMKDFRFGIIVLLAVVSFLLFRANETNLYFILMSVTSALVIFGSIFFGERLHIRLTEKIVKRVEKEAVHVAVRTFVEQAKKVACHHECEGKDVLDIKLYNTVNELKKAAVQAASLNQRELAEQIEEIAKSCATLSRLSIRIQSQDDTDYVQFQTLADQLLNISWDTLCQTEQQIRTDMKKSWNTITFAVKTVHMK